MWLSLGYHIGSLAALLWLAGFCIERRSWVGLLVTVVFAAVSAVLLGLLVWALRARYGGILRALRRE